MILLVIALASTDCAGCHPREAETLALSRHAVAAQLPVFVEPARTANAAWCASCHQPAGRKTAGLDCLSCHRVAGDPEAVRAGRLLPTTATRAHKTVVDTQFAITACAGCHEFTTPLPDSLERGPVAYSDQPLQSTVSELRASDPKATCASCHDVHRGNGAHDAALVRGAAQWSARVVGDGVEVIAEAGAIGHRFPTGDPFRRLVIAVCEDADCARSVETQVLDRRFGLVGTTWTSAFDRRLQDRERRVLRFPRARYWRVELRYGDPKHEAKLPANEVTLELARGLVESGEGAPGNGR